MNEVGNQNFVKNSDENENISYVDKVEITTVIDNYLDVFLPDTTNVKRWGPPDSVPGNRVAYMTSPPLMAEHGLSLFIKVYKGGETQVFLFDAGFTEKGVPSNLKKLGIDISEINSIIISHGNRFRKNTFDGCQYSLSL